MLRVRLLPGHFEPDQGNQRRTCIGKIVESIRSDSDGIADKTGQKLTDKKKDIKTDSHASAKHSIGLPDRRAFRLFIVFNKKSGQQLYHDATSLELK